MLLLLWLQGKVPGEREGWREGGQGERVVSTESRNEWRRDDITDGGT